MNKTECINLFNKFINSDNTHINKILEIISDYLTEINCEKSTEIISLIQQNPILLNKAFPKAMNYFILKYCILSLIFNNKTILYYE